VAPTPKARTAKKKVVARSRAKLPMKVTGEPEHNVYKLRSLVSVWANDARDLLFDWADMVHGLSKEDPEEADVEPGVGPEVLVLGASALELLRVGVHGTAASFRAQAAADEDSASQLLGLLEHRNVLESPVWQQHFGAVPPHGTIARLVRRLGKPCSGARGYRNKEELVQEAGRIRNWYKPGRKLQRPRRGIKRKLVEADYVTGRKTAWTCKVAAHYSHFLKPVHLDGLWQWRLIARALIRANIRVHSGTVPVERLWSVFRQYFPAASRTMSLEWWKLLASLGYMNYNYKHFHRSNTLTEDDGLLAQRIDMLVSLTRELHAESAGDDGVLRALSEVFSGDS